MIFSLLFISEDLNQSAFIVHYIMYLLYSPGKNGAPKNRRSGQDPGGIPVFITRQKCGDLEMGLYAINLIAGLGNLPSREG